jgi:hypothetical protein
MKVFDYLLLLSLWFRRSRLRGNDRAAIRRFKVNGLNSHVLCTYSAPSFVIPACFWRESSDSAEYDFRTELDSRLRGNDGATFHDAKG